MIFANNEIIFTLLTIIFIVPIRLGQRQIDYLLLHYISNLLLLLILLFCA
jgi:hypothetical protein